MAGQVVVLPADWEPTVRAAVAFAVSVAVGVLTPIVRDFVRQAAADMTGRRQAEAERDDAKRELAEARAETERLREGLTVLAPPSRPSQQEL